MSAETYTLEEVNELVSLAFAVGGYFALEPVEIFKSDLSDDVKYIAEVLARCEDTGRSSFPGKRLIKDKINAAIFAHFHQDKATKSVAEIAKNN